MVCSPTLSVVIVAHESLADLRRSLPPLVGQLGHGDELIVVDSGSTDALELELERLAPEARLIAAPGNVGFAGGANLGVAQADGELIVLLNPDAIVQPGWATALKRPWDGEWAAWMGLVTMNGGERINTSGGVLHFTGLGWAGQTGQSIALAPDRPATVGFLSGACLAIPAATWRQLGGFSERYFMYCEDVDLSLRIRLRGGALGVIPDARVVHSYEFDKGPAKWRLLERNRWATIVRDYPGPVLVLLLPALLATEIGIWIAALRGGWIRMKALALCDVARALPRLLRERRPIQRARQIDSATFATAMTAEIDSPYIGLGGNALVRQLLRRYFGAFVWLLAAARRWT